MTEAELAAYAAHIKHEVIMVALLPVALEAAERSRSEETARSGYGVTPNALFEALLVHGRLLDEFTSQKPGTGRRDTVYAYDYVPGWKPFRTVSWRSEANRQVAHLASGRTGPADNPDADAIRKDIGERMTSFYAALPDDRKKWFVAIPEHFSAGITA